MDPTMWLVAFLVVYLLFISILVYTILVGGAARYQSGCVGRIHKFLTITLSQKGKSWAAKVLCPRAEDPESRAAQVFGQVAYVFEKYVMFVAYLGLLWGGLAVANRVLMTRLDDLDAFSDGGDDLCPRTKLFCVDPEGLFTFPPRTSGDAVYIYGFLALGTWLAVYLADPGIVNAQTFEKMKALYPYDEIIFLSGKECRTCKQPKLPRTKHDSLIGACVARYDHFCGWTGNAIGLYNTNRFCLFLLMHLTMLMHGAALCAEVIYARMLTLIEGHYIYVPTGKPITSFSVVVAFAAEPTLSMFLVVLCITILVVGGFLYYHVSLIARNTTTSESCKWSPVNKICNDYKREHGRSYGEALREAAEKEATETKSVMRYVPPFNPDGLPVNIYDRGIIENVIEVLLPSIFVRQVRRQQTLRGVKAE